MRFDHAFEVAGLPADVIEVFDDVPLLASFLPGASAGQIRDDGSHPGQLVVSFGPKRLTFKGSLRNRVDHAQLSGELTGQASADVRGARMLVTMGYQLAPGACGTRIEITSEAELTGILAEFARTGGVVITQALLDDFAQRLSAHMRARMATQSAVPDAAAPPTAPAPATLSGFALLLKMLTAFFKRRS